MKSIPLIGATPSGTADVIRIVAERPTPGQGISPDEMRRRCRVLDALDAIEGAELMLEDADHAFLVRLINVFQFGMANRELLAIIDGIVKAGQSSVPGAVDH